MIVIPLNRIILFHQSVVHKLDINNHIHIKLKLFVSACVG